MRARACARARVLFHIHPESKRRSQLAEMKIDLASDSEVDNRNVSPDQYNYWLLTACDDPVESQAQTPDNLADTEGYG